MLINAISPIRRLKGEEGQDLVEAAFAVPILITLVCGIIDFGWAFMNNVMVSNAAREGARFAVMNYEDAETSDPGDPIGCLQGQITTNVEHDLPDHLTDSSANLQVTLSENAGVGSDDKVLLVEIRSDIKMFTYVGIGALGRTYTVTRQASMKKLN